MKIVLFSTNNPDHYFGLLAQHRYAMSQSLAAKENGTEDPGIQVRVSCRDWTGVIVATHPERCAFSILVTNNRG
jgi:hypothetical protein